MSTVGFDKRMLEIFDEVCDLQEPDLTREVERRCNGDAQLATRVRQMIACDQDDVLPISTGVLGAGAEMLAMDVASSGTPDRIGSYEVIRELGRGGMGIVYEAKQENPQRHVAIKVIKEGFNTDETLRRFKREAEALGRLQHPGVAHVYEAGVDRSGRCLRPFYAMELIEGLPLDQHAEQQGLDLAERLELIARVCDAVQHAHHKGILHRDLKCANVLVATASDERADTSLSLSSTTTIDRIGQPKVLDFGIARLTDAADPATRETYAGQILGSLQTMSPEQLEGNIEATDTRSDVYAVGVIMYRLLAGRDPYDLRRKSIPEAIRLIRESEPASLGSIDSHLYGDLSVIAAKAMAPEVGHRYESAAALAEDLRRVFRDEPILARPASGWYRASKFVRRNKAPVFGVVATFVALLAGLITSSVLLVRADEARVEALKAQYEAELAGERAREVASIQSRMILGLEYRAVGDVLIEQLNEQWANDAGIEVPKTVLRNVARELFAESFARNADRTLDEMEVNDPLVEVDLRGSIAELFARLQLAEEALVHFRRWADLTAEIYGVDSIENFEAQSRVAAALNAATRKDDAIEALESVITSASRVLGERHTFVCDTQYELAMLLANTGRHSEAERLQSSVAEKRGEEEPADTMGIAFKKSDEAFFHLSHQEFDEAIRLYEDALEIVLTTDEDWARGHVHWAKFQLGAAFASAGRLDDAIIWMKEALEAGRAEQGDLHESPILTRKLIGQFYMCLDQAALAEPYLRGSTEDALRIFAETDHNVVSAQVLHSWALYELGAYEEGLQIAQRCARSTESGEGSAQEIHANAHYWRSRHMDALGDEDGARSAFEVAVTGRKDSPADSPFHPFTPPFGLWAAGTLAAQGRQNAAIQMARFDYERLVQACGNDHPLTQHAAALLHSFDGEMP
ncbi:MAG: serine/threonine-protein kinase [Planctomycetota bacterium]